MTAIALVNAASIASAIVAAYALGVYVGKIEAYREARRMLRGEPAATEQWRR